MCSRLNAAHTCLPSAFKAVKCLRGMHHLQKDRCPLLLACSFLPALPILHIPTFCAGLSPNILACGACLLIPTFCAGLSPTTLTYGARPLPNHTHLWCSATQPYSLVQASPQPYSLVVLGQFSGILQGPDNPVRGKAGKGACVSSYPCLYI